MFLDLTPLRKHRDYRLLYAGQSISMFGSMVTYVAVPYQVFQITRSSLWVGLLGTAQLVPLLCAALFGGAFADSLDRRRLLVTSELALSCGSLALLVNASMPHPSAPVMFLAAGFISAVNGFHSPALQALTPRLVPREDLTAVSALNSLRGNVAAVGGPACGGLLIATWGFGVTYAFDVLSFLVSLVCLWFLRAPAQIASDPSPTLKRIASGLSYAKSRPELIGTYVVDIVAVIFAMPVALFPSMSERWSGAAAAGWLYSAMAVGSLVMTLFSGWTSRVRRHGAAVVLAALAWGASIVALGFVQSLPLAVLCLTLAGAADMVSGLFRMTIWNETIPDQLRGRLAGVEMMSYMTGPLLGNARAGWVASRWSDTASLLSGGVLCILGVAACAALLPAFWRYEKSSATGDALDESAASGAPVPVSLHVGDSTSTPPASS